MNILLTGATGFLGSHLLESFVSRGFKVVILKRSTSQTYRINHLLKEVKSYDIDLLSNLDIVFEDNKIDVIVHTACSYGRRNESLVEIVNSNLIFGLTLMELGIKNKVKTFINTDSLLPRNLNNYSLSKSQLSDWLQKFSSDIQIINLKVEHMYGPKDDTKKFLPWLIDEMINGTKEINLTSGVQKRDFIYIDDVVSAFISVINFRDNLDNWNEFDVGTNLLIKVKDFVLLVAKELEKVNKNNKIITKLKFGAIPYRDSDIMVPELDNSNLLCLGWKPKISIEEGIQKILKK
jgi:CDP-paratose synthetase